MWDKAPCLWLYGPISLILLIHSSTSLYPSSEIHAEAYLNISTQEMRRISSGAADMHIWSAHQICRVTAKFIHSASANKVYLYGLLFSDIASQIRLQTSKENESTPLSSKQVAKKSSNPLKCLLGNKYQSIRVTSHDLINNTKRQDHSFLEATFCCKEFPLVDVWGSKQIQPCQST